MIDTPTSSEYQKNKFQIRIKSQALKSAEHESNIARSRHNIIVIGNTPVSVFVTSTSVYKENPETNSNAATNRNAIQS